MKIRQGFVSNSSSSSFVCLVSGEVEGGYDVSLSDAGMCECVNGHVFCEQYRLARPPVVQNLDIEDHDEDDDLYDEDPNYDVPENQCPICTLTKITDRDLLAYAMKKNNWDRKKIEENMREDFSNYSTFLKGMKA